MGLKEVCAVVLVLAYVATAADLLFVGEVCRHGARSPTKKFPFDSKYWDSKLSGELTSSGMRQHYLLGTELRKRYIEDVKFLSSEYNSQEIFVISSAYNRTILSAMSQMQGLYPLTTGPKVSNNHPRPPMKVSDLEAIETSLGDAALPGYLQVIPIHMESDSLDILLRGYDSDVCPRMDQLEEKTLTSAEYLAKEQSWQSLFQEFSSIISMNITTIDKCASAYSALVCDEMEGFPLPEGMTQELMDELSKVHGYSKFYSPFSDEEARNLSCSNFFKDLSRRMNGRLNDKGAKFVLYSAHDTTLAAFLSCLDKTFDYNPPFASTVFFELYSDETVVVKFNDEELTFSECGDKICTFSDFEKILEKRYIEDFEAACKLQ
jgi:hypothetical protein